MNPTNPTSPKTPTSPTGPSSRTVTLIPGDSITAELADPVLRILDKAGAELTFERMEAGAESFRNTGVALPDEVIESVRKNRVALKGKFLALPDAAYPSLNVELRKRLDLFAMVYPIGNLPGLPSRHDGVDIVLIRESTEDIYGGHEDRIGQGIVTSMKVVTEHGCRRVARFAFEFAKVHKRNHVTVIHKANIMKVTDGMFLRVAEQTAAGYPGIRFDSMIVDAASMHLVLRPRRFDVMLAGNLYGGILADLGAGVVGGISASMGASRNEEIAVFECIHGEAPHLMGKNLANPLPMLMPATHMLRHLGQDEPADRILAAVSAVLKKKVATPDLGGSATTAEMADAIIDAL